MFESSVINKVGIHVHILIIFVFSYVDINQSIRKVTLTTHSNIFWSIYLFISKQFNINIEVLYGYLIINYFI